MFKFDNSLFLKPLLRVSSTFIKPLAVLVLFTIVLTSTPSYGQAESITFSGGASTQTFNAMGSSTTAALPIGWKQGTDWLAGSITNCTQSAGSSGSGALNSTSSGGFYNFAQGINSSSTERALGFLSSSTYSSPRSLIYAFTNNTGSTITSVSISWNYEKYRSGSRAFNWTFFHGSSSNATIAATGGDQAFAADANNNSVFNPPSSTAKSLTLSGLSIANGATYYLRWTYTGSGGSTNGQALGIDDFSITLNPTLLPVELESFQANCEDDFTSTLVWTTASEHNTSHFEVQKSINGEDWRTVGITAAAGYSTQLLTYQMTDNEINHQTSYYRLKQYDRDGKFEYYHTSSLNCNNEVANSRLIVYPNPSGSQFYVSFYSEKDEPNGSIVIVDAIGKIVYERAITIGNGNNNIYLDALNLEKGMYTIQLNQGASNFKRISHLINN